FRAAAGLGKTAERRIRRGGEAVAAMIVRVDMKAVLAEETGEAAVALRVFGQAVVDLHHGAAATLCLLDVKIEKRPRRRCELDLAVEWHRIPCSKRPWFVETDCRLPPHRLHSAQPP